MDANETLAFARVRERKATRGQLILLRILPIVIGVLLVAVGAAVGSRL